jgi:hypothetical protein
LIATRNGVPIIKDGKLATNCDCCEFDPCSANWRNALSGISVEIEAEDLFYQYQGISTADFNDPVFGIFHPAGTKHVFTFAWAGSRINGTKSLAKVPGSQSQWQYSLPFEPPYCYSQFSAVSNPFGAPRGNYVLGASVSSQALELFAGFSGRRELSAYGQDGPQSFADMTCAQAANSLTGEHRNDFWSSSLTWRVGLVACRSGELSYPALPWERAVNVPFPIESDLPGITGSTPNIFVVVPASPTPGLSQDNFLVGTETTNWHRPVFRVTEISLSFDNPLP